MFTRAQLVRAMHVEFDFPEATIQHLIAGFNRYDDYEFIKIYKKKTGHKLTWLRKNLYA